VEDIIQTYQIGVHQSVDFSSSKCT